MLQHILVLVCNSFLWNECSGLYGIEPGSNEGSRLGWFQVEFGMIDLKTEVLQCKQGSVGGFHGVKMSVCYNEPIINVRVNVDTLKMKESGNCSHALCKSPWGHRESEWEGAELECQIVEMEVEVFVVGWMDIGKYSSLRLIRTNHSPCERRGIMV